jgi:hypothetical protein
VLNENGELLDVHEMPCTPEEDGSRRSRLWPCPWHHRGLRRRTRPAERCPHFADLKATRRNPAGREEQGPARTSAIARWPAHTDLFASKRDVDRTEARLIVLAGLRFDGRIKRLEALAGVPDSDVSTCASR